MLGLLFLKKFLSERIMNAVQAHNIQVWKEFSNIKDTYLKRLFKNTQKPQRIRKTWPFTSKPKALRNVSKYLYLLCNMKRKSISFHQPVSTWWQWSLATWFPLEMFQVSGQLVWVGLAKEKCFHRRLAGLTLTKADQSRDAESFLFKLSTNF